MKRSHDTAMSGLQRKKQKLRAARNIASQSASSSIKSGNVPIQEYLSARSYEIKALVNSMQKSREAGVQRAFQSLPRYLRRRAASHNVKRVPRRLRAKARLELTEDDKVAPHRRVPFKRKRGRHSTMKKLARLRQKAEVKEHFVPANLEDTDLPEVRPMPMTRYIKRQKNKTWLPSHLWTSKRAKMYTRWAYAIAESPNEKTYRSTHRASTSKGAIIFDTSYTCTILLHGTGLELQKVLLSVTNDPACCGARARKGQRTVESKCFDGDAYICPVVFIWDTASDDNKALIMRIHPSCFLRIWKLLLTRRKELGTESVKVTDHRFNIGSIDLFGPTAINALLSTCKSTSDTPISRAFRSLHGLEIDELPSNVIVPLTVRDFRSSFPAKMITEKAKSVNPYLSKWPVFTSSFDLHATTNETDRSIIIYKSGFGVTVLAKWELIGDLFYTLNHLPHIRFGGQQELQQLHYEYGRPFFPGDYRGCEAGDAAAKVLELSERAKWERTPPAKRRSFKMETLDPFSCDFDGIGVDVSHVSDTQQSQIQSQTPSRYGGTGLMHVIVTLQSRGSIQRNARVSRNGTIIGFIVSGNFNLCLGKSSGMGLIFAHYGVGEVTVRNVGSSVPHKAMASMTR